jgi:protein-ribulosamine 3-kinase
VGKGMCEAEFEGVSKLYQIAPDFVPQPVGWGTYKADSNAHFYLAEFVDMIEEQPDMPKFCSALAKLHKDSMKLSNGLFGFHVVTYSGTMYQAVEWTSSWEELWINSIKAYAVQEQEIHGPSEKLDKLLSVYYEKVCSRLLRPLQTGGRMIRPVLIHGDIWYGNIATNAENGEPILFDPSVFWGHNECQRESCQFFSNVALMDMSDDLSTMDIPRYRMGRHWMREYHRNFPISSPEVGFLPVDSVLEVSVLAMFRRTTLFDIHHAFRKNNGKHKSADYYMQKEPSLIIREHQEDYDDRMRCYGM